MKGYIFDLDGTLYRGNEPLPFAVETITQLQKKGKSVAFMTNNSSLTREEQADKLASMGFSCDAGDIWPSSLATAQELIRLSHQRALVVGETGLHRALSEYGLITDEEEPDAVVVGIYRSLSYSRLCRALEALSSGAAFFATNTDATYPLENGRIEPGAGAIVAYLERASGRRAYVCGKPNPRAFLDVIEYLKLDPHEVMVVGDRYDTDIEGGRALGCATWMVLTGVTNVLPENQPGSEMLDGLPQD